MSLTKSATHRLSLFSSTSLVAAGIAAAASLGAMSAPGAALAQVCSQSQADVNDAAADIVTCTAGTYASGIQYTAVGDLDVTVLTGSNFGTGGVAAAAGASSADTDNLTLRLTGSGTVTAHAFSTAFPALMNAESQAGDVLVEVQVNRTNSNNAPTVSANNAVTTRAVRAVSNAGGDVTVRSLGTGTAGLRNGRIESTTHIDAVGIEARSVGGGDVTVDLGLGVAAGRLYGIMAQADGDGAVSITGSATSSGVGSVGLRVVADTGLVTVVGGSTAFGGRTGVHIDTNGDIDFTGGVSGNDYGMDIVDVAAGTTTTLNLTQLGGGLAAVRASGAGDIVVNMIGAHQAPAMRFDFSGMAERVNVTVAEGALWRAPDGASTVSGQNYDIVVAQGGGFQAGRFVPPNTAIEAPVVVTFANPDIVFRNEGFLIIGQKSTTTVDVTYDETEVRFEGLGQFRHSGIILMGGVSRDLSTQPSLGDGGGGGRVRTDITDGWHDDILSMPGVNWVGEGGRIVMDVDLGRSQANCERNLTNGDLAAADCLKLVGGTTEGVTYITINEIAPGDRIRPTAEGIVLVEVTGGTSAQGHFSIDPTVSGASPLFGGSQDRGLYHYLIGYDDSARQHILYGVVGGGSYQLAQYATAAQSLWRVSTGSWLDRQADVRSGVEAGIGGGVWLRASGEIAERDVQTGFQSGGRTFAFDNSHEQTSYAVTGGLDLMSASADDLAWVVGVMAGYTYADIKYDTWANTGQLDGFSAGAYASFLSGGLFVDAALNANRVILKNDLPGLGLLPAGSILDTILLSLGAQVEAGWRLPLSDTLFVEPLAGVSYVVGKNDDLEVASADPSRPGLVVRFDDPTSLRANLGARVGVDHDYGPVRAQYSVTARAWNEFEGENTILLHNEFVPNEPDVAVADGFTGSFGELGFNASVYSAGGAVSGFVSLGGKFGDGYQAKAGTVGVRVAW